MTKPRRPKAAPPTAAQELARIATAAKGTTPSPVLASGPLVWAAPVRVDANPIEGLSCPSVSLCVAVDNHGRAVDSTSPLAGGKGWESVDTDGSNFLAAVSCPARNLCVAVDGAGNIATTDAPGAASDWAVGHVDSSVTEPSPYGGGPELLRGLSCPSTKLCVAVDSVGNVVYSGNPAGGPTAWIVAHIDNNSDYGCAGGGLNCQAPLMGVSCPSVSLCSAVDFTGNILRSTTPTAWSSSYVGGAPPKSLWSVSCPTTSLCATVDGTTGNVVTWNPARNSRPIARRLPVQAFGVWCDSAGLCLASGEAPNGTAELVGSTNPTAKSPTWKVTNYGDVDSVSCPNKSTCVASDDQGQISVGATVASLTATMRREAISSVPKIGALVSRRGYTLRFTAPIPGELQIKWTTVAAKPATLATATADFTAPQTRTVELKLNSAGRRLLKGARRARVRATATYKANTGAVVTKRVLTLR
ncbi:MAG: hypothetical protein WAK93_02530 [Solirubrobacteraceae bacterium]